MLWSRYVWWASWHMLMLRWLWIKQWDCFLPRTMVRIQMYIYMYLYDYYYWCLLVGWYVVNSINVYTDKYHIIHSSIYPFNHLSIHSSLNLFIHLSIHSSIYLSIHSSIFRCIYLFIHPSIHSLIHVAYIDNHMDGCFYLYITGVNVLFSIISTLPVVDIDMDRYCIWVDR